MAAPPQQIVYVDQNGNPIQAQQQIVYVDQNGNPVQPQQVVQQQQAVELQVGMNTQVPSDAPPTYENAPIDDEYATQNNVYENPQRTNDEHGYIYDNPPTDEKHEWVNDDDLPPPGYDDVAPKEGLGFVQGCKDTPHFKAWFCTILVFFPIFCYIICLASGISNQCYCETWDGEQYTDESALDTCNYELHCGFPCVFTYQIGAGFWGIVAGAYLLYIIEATCCSSSCKYLKNSMDGETVYHWVDTIKQNAPRIWWRVECYHYETRTEHYTDSKGNRQTRTKRVKVVTHRASMDYAYGSWCDISKDVTGLDEFNLTKFTAYKQFSFADQATENDYNMKSAAFRRNNDRDQYQSFYYGVEVAGYKKKMLFEVKPGTKGPAVTLSCYLMSSFLLFTVCYRIYFAAICGRKDFVFDKQVKMAQNQQTVIIAAQNVVVIQPQQPNVIVVQQ